MSNNTFKRCLVIGGGGFIGLHLSRALSAEGYYVRILSLSPAGTKAFNILGVERGKIEWMVGDYSDVSLLQNALKDVDIVFHSVSSTIPANSNEDMNYDILSNLIPTLSFLNMTIQSKIKKVIFISSGGTIYGHPSRLPIPEDHPTNPICSYGIHKLAIEKYLHLYNYLHQLDYLILRLSNPYGLGQNIGRGQGVVSSFLAKAIKGDSVEIWGDGLVVRDYIHIDDVAAACLSVLNYTGVEKIFNIGSGVGLSVLEVLIEIEHVLGISVNKIFLENRKVDVKASILDITRARLHLGWEPTLNFKQGLVKVVSRGRDIAIENN